MVMEVADGYVTVTVDGFKYVYEMALPSYNNGGYILPCGEFCLGRIKKY